MNVGDIQVVCPGCGQLLTGEVALANMVIDANYLYVILARVDIRHRCKENR